MTNLIKTIHYELMKAQNIILAPHPFPDGDALGSSSAFFEYLNRRNKNVKIFCPTEINPKLKFLPNFPPIHKNPEIFLENIQIVVVLDSGDLRYAGIQQYLKNHPAKIINIDHHATNEFFGHYNLVITQAASTTEVVFKYFEEIKEEITSDMATDLLTGIITDTDSFTNSATHSQVLSIAGELMRKGANYKLITTKLHKNKDLEMLKLWGLAFSRLMFIPELDLVYTYLKQDDFAQVGLKEGETEGLANFMNNIDGPKISLILKETEDKKIKGSFRTTYNDIDVSLLAKKFNGGGHKKAAGFTVESSIAEVIETILTLHHK